MCCFTAETSYDMHNASELAAVSMGKQKEASNDTTIYAYKR